MSEEYYPEPYTDKFPHKTSIPMIEHRPDSIVRNTNERIWQISRIKELDNYVDKLEQTILSMLNCEVCGGSGKVIIDNESGEILDTTWEWVELMDYDDRAHQDDCQCRENARKVVRE